ncbi:BRO1-domain-containing protein [Ceratobasidium sp. AG-I]|nr:BRO1-domain-containing protein [Ceratobasidium sp. AG-I]
MPNQVHIPFKQTSPAQIKDSIQSYIEFNHTDAHPDAFKWDISRWEELRRDGVGGYVHVSRVDAAILYHAHLVLLLTKFPTDIGLTFTYDPAFPSVSRRPCSADDLVFERACVLFNLAALYSQLGTSGGRNNTDDIKLAAANFQNAAGVLQYLSKEVVPLLASSLGQAASMPSELLEPSLKSLELLMLAQAQECFWQKASMESYKDGTLAKLAKQASLFRRALSAVANLSASPFPQEWINHSIIKKHHFEGVAQFRQSRSDLQTHKYGLELRRLKLAQNEVKQGLERASRGVAKAVIDDIKSLSKTLDSNFARAQKDNDLIYHQTVPPESTLPTIGAANMVQSIANNKLQDPSLVIGNTDNALFSGLVAYGVRMAIEVYVDRRENWIKEEVEGGAKELDTEITRLLQKLNLPGSLDALDKPAGIPPSLLRRSEEIRSMGGVDSLQHHVDEVQELGTSAGGVLEEAFDSLDTEASEDETFLAQLSEDAAQFATASGYLPSHKANKELVAKANSYRQILDNAASSDAVVRGKWEEWEENVAVLSSQPDEMEQSIPSHTTSANSPDLTQAHTYGRAIRAALESLDDLRNARARCIESARQRASTDDIKPRLVREAAGLARWVEVKPAMFEETMEEEMGKFDRYKDSVEEGKEKQDELLAQVEHLNDLLIQARTNDPVLKDREAALQSLDLAYHRYLEVLSNVTEGAKFYTDFSNHLNVFQDECTRWVELRRAQRRCPSTQYNSLPIIRSQPQSQTEPEPEVECIPPQRDPTPPPIQPVIPTMPKEFALPAPDSAEWESFDLPSPPAPPSARKPTRTKVVEEPTPRRKTRSRAVAD